MAKKAKMAEQVVLEAEVVTPETALAEAFGPVEGAAAVKAVQAIGSFIAGMRAFFTRANELNEAAIAAIEDAAELQLPNNADEDVAIQKFIRAQAAGEKEAAEHWKPITSALHGLHRLTTGGRDKAVKARQRAGAMAQQHHNRYLEIAERKRLEEQRRLDAEAEARARAAREAEAADVERRALEAEEAASDVSEREKRLIVALLAGMTPIAAARAAGYKNPETVGPQLVERKKILDAMAAAKLAENLKRQAEAVRTAPLEMVAEEAPSQAVAAPGAHDRNTYSAEVFDERLLIAAVLSGRYGIPSDILTVRPAEMNALARQLREQINRWPGVRLKKTTTTI